MSPKIRIESPEGMGHSTRVFYVDESGEETEISRAIREVDLHLKVGEANTALLHAIVVGGDVQAEIDDVVLTRLKPGKRRLVDISGLGDLYRRWTLAR